MRKVFISYSHRQGEWVWDRLVPVLRAGGAEVLIDKERFRLGLAVFDQQDALQDEADLHLLCFSPDYLASPACQREMERAVGKDPEFERGVVIPVKLGEVELPHELATRNPLYADLQDDGDAAVWDQVLDACGADLGASVPAWLTARDETRRLLEREESVNLVTRGENLAWKGLLEALPCDYLQPLAQVDLSNPVTNSRRGLSEEVLRVFGIPAEVPQPPEDLVFFGKQLEGERCRGLALVRFDLVLDRPDYGHNLFAAIRFLVMETRQLLLLVQSRRALARLLPVGHPISQINLQQVELRGRS